MPHSVPRFTTTLTTTWNDEDMIEIKQGDQFPNNIVIHIITKWNRMITLEITKK